MKKIIHYTQEIPVINDAGEQIGTDILNLSVESNNDKDFNEQLETVKSYCGDAYTIEEIEEIPTIEERLEALEEAVLNR